jgi:hypothetical protein
MDAVARLRLPYLTVLPGMAQEQILSLAVDLLRPV